MCEFPGVTFHPWVGENYADSRFELRLLVLGESHYNEDPECDDHDFTQWVVRNWGQENRHTFFTKVAKVLLGLGAEVDINDAERSEIWEHVAFYNFVQSIVAPCPRVRPADHQWDEAQAPFATVLQRLEPHAVLMLSYRLDEHVLHRPENISFRAIVHPSSGFYFSYNRAIPAFKELLADARRKRCLTQN